jgi:beta-fructofuranosidase
MVAHQVQQQEDGTLTVAMPDPVRQALQTPQPVAFTAGVGLFNAQGNGVQMDSAGAFSCASAGTLPPACRIKTTATFEAGTRNFGILLRMSDNFESGYYIRFEPAMQRLVFDAWPRPGDVPFMCELERPIRLHPGEPLEIEVLVEGSVCEVYAGGTVAMSARLYNHAQGQWGVFAGEGDVQFSEVSIHV